MNTAGSFEIQRLREDGRVQIRGEVYTPPLEARPFQPVGQRPHRRAVEIVDSRGQRVDTIYRQQENGYTRLGRLTHRRGKELLAEVREEVQKLNNEIQQCQQQRQEQREQATGRAGYQRDELDDDRYHLQEVERALERERQSRSEQRFRERNTGWARKHVVPILTVTAVALLWMGGRGLQAAVDSTPPAPRAETATVLSSMSPTEEKLRDLLTEFPARNRTHRNNTGQPLTPAQAYDLPAKVRIRYSPHYHQQQTPDKKAYVLEALHAEQHLWCAYNHTNTALKADQTFLGQSVTSGDIECRQH